MIEKGHIGVATNKDGPVDYAYRRWGNRSFSKTLAAVEQAVCDHGFVVLRRYDIGETMVAKGFAIRPLVIMEVGPAEEDVSTPLSLVLPCRINVYEENGVVVVAALRPTIFIAVYPEHRLDEVAAEMEDTVVSIVDGAVS